MAFLAALACPWAASAHNGQTPVDRIDPAVLEQTLSDDEARTPRPSSPGLSMQTENEDAMTSPGAFTVGAVRVEGATVLAPADFAPAIEPYLGRRLDEAELRALVRDISEVARTAGFGLATAWIPPQDVVNGILRVRIEEGRIDAIEVEGAAARLVRARLAPLANGQPVRTAALERRLRIAGDAAGVHVG
jgi:hemolysin activation/secretion protein